MSLKLSVPGGWARPDGRLSAVRLVAALTMTYSVAITIAPRLMARPCRMLDLDGRVPPEIATLIRSVGVRDAALAAALLIVPPGPAAATLTAARVVCDGGDAVWFGSLPVKGGQRAKISAVAAGWAAIETLAHLADQRS
jgi:hypothetical protein